MYECDGCGLTGTLEEVEIHINQQDFEDITFVTCWGAMEVGGPAWKRYHEDNIHPMQVLTNKIKKLTPPTLPS